MNGGLARPDSPFALVEKQRGAMRLAALSRQAAELGLACGMALADARGIVPDLATLPHDAEADTMLVEKMAQQCIAYTPSVMPDPPNGILLDITGCDHLHGGEDSMREKIAVLFRQRGFTLSMGAADTPDAARALSRLGGDDICALPLEALDTDETTRTALRRAGFRSIGDLVGLPPAPLATRFGSQLVRLLDRLIGRKDPHIVPHLPPQDIRAELCFAEPIGRHGDVLDAIEWLATQAAGQLTEAGQGGRAFLASLYRSDGYIARLRIETGAPTRDPALLMRLFNERIDSLSDPLDPGFGYDSVTLDVSHAEALEVKQHSLAPEQGDNGDIGPLLDRLAVRYGPAAILRFAAGNSHIPERAGFLAKARNEKGEYTGSMHETSEPPLRPLFLLDPPQQVEVLAAIPDGPPRRFRWRGEQHLVRLYEGPERIAPEWWRRRLGHEQPGFSRDYYRVEDENGRRFWLVRHGLYGRETDQPRWYVHGLFA